MQFIASVQIDCSSNSVAAEFDGLLPNLLYTSITKYICKPLALLGSPRQQLRIQFSPPHFVQSNSSRWHPCCAEGYLNGTCQTSGYHWHVLLQVGSMSCPQVHGGNVHTNQHTSNVYIRMVRWCTNEVAIEHVQILFHFLPNTPSHSCSASKTWYSLWHKCSYFMNASIGRSKTFAPTYMYVHNYNYYDIHTHELACKVSEIY